MGMRALPQVPLAADDDKSDDKSLGTP